MSGTGGMNGTAKAANVAVVIGTAIGVLGVLVGAVAVYYGSSAQQAAMDARQQAETDRFDRVQTRLQGTDAVADARIWDLQRRLSHIEGQLDK